MGAYISIVSRLFSRCFLGDWYSMVRILCSRSQTLMRITRISRLMAMSILRRFSICSSSLVTNCILVSLVTPSTSSATAGLNFLAISSWVEAVSSMQSWSRAATSASMSSSRSATISATAMGWMI